MLLLFCIAASLSFGEAQLYCENVSYRHLVKNMFKLKLTPRIALGTNETPKLALGTNEIPKLALRTNETPKLFLRTNETPKLALGTNETPKRAIFGIQKDASTQSCYLEFYKDLLLRKRTMQNRKYNLRKTHINIFLVVGPLRV